MERAAQKAAEKITSIYQKQDIHIFCGPGNNGGDGLAIARILNKQSWNVSVSLIDLEIQPSKDFSINLDRLPSSVRVNTLNRNTAEPIIKDGIIIDCIFGSGLNRPISGWIKDNVKWINQLPNNVVSIDIPSGLYATDNRSNDLNAIIKANHTLTFQCPKMSFFYPEYQKFVGHFHIVNIGLHPAFQANPLAIFTQKEEIVLNPKSNFDHKGSNGFLTLIAGHHPMQGAGVLGVKAAFNTGCGYVGWLTNKANHLDMLQVVPEAMLLESISPKSTAIAIGPGLGTDDKALEMLLTAIAEEIPLVLDADALQLIATHQINPPKDCILTPHLGELKALIGHWDSPEECLELQIAYAKKHHVYLLQKGAYSKICTPSGLVYINSTGNKYMAKAGMGDTLTGMIGSLLAQGYHAKNALINAVFIHGMAGDIAASKKGLSTLASDVSAEIPAALKELSQTNINN
jgi:NAD(P)H-hydrate epimerase